MTTTVELAGLAVFAEVVEPFRGVAAYCTEGGWIGVVQADGRCDEVKAELVVTSGRLIAARSALAAAEVL